MATRRTKVKPKKRAAARRSRPVKQPRTTVKPKKQAAARRSRPVKQPRAARTPAVTVASSSVDDHPGYALLVKRLRPGPVAGGLVVITAPGALDREVHDWLMGNVAGRRSIGRTAFGDLLVFRDLRERARELGVGDADREGDVALIDVHFKKMTVLGTSVESFLDGLDDELFQRAFLRKELFDEVKRRLGACKPTECYGFVPALALGGSEDADTVRRVDWRVHQAILLQS